MDKQERIEAIFGKNKGIIAAMQMAEVIKKDKGLFTPMLRLALDPILKPIKYKELNSKELYSDEQKEIARYILEQQTTDVLKIIMSNICNKHWDDSPKDESEVPIELLADICFTMIGFARSCCLAWLFSGDGGDVQEKIETTRSLFDAHQ